ncbi:MAG TPA: NAD(P)H-dependent oxidoreductase subunit E, partial [Nitrospirota bacterium]
FSLKPKGRHTVSVCLGTACHVKGSERILRTVETALEVMEGETTADMRFTVGAVRCVGACSLAPVMVVDKETHGKVNAKQVSAILKKYE